MKSVLLIISATVLWSQQSAAKPLSSVISASKSSRKKNDSFSILARVIQSRVNEDASYDVDAIASALRNLSKAQNALKKIDGTGKLVSLVVIIITNECCIRSSDV